VTTVDVIGLTAHFCITKTLSFVPTIVVLPLGFFTPATDHFDRFSSLWRGV